MGLPRTKGNCEALHGILDLITDQIVEGNARTMAGFGRFEAKKAQGPARGGTSGEAA